MEYYRRTGCLITLVMISFLLAAKDTKLNIAFQDILHLYHVTGIPEEHSLD